MYESVNVGKYVYMNLHIPVSCLDVCICMYIGMYGYVYVYVCMYISIYMGISMLECRHVYLYNYVCVHHMSVGL